MRSIVWIPRHEFASFPCCGCPLSVEPILLTPRCEFIFCSGSLFDIQTLGLLEVVVADSTLTCFCVCFRFSSFPLKWFPASKRSLWDQAFPCLGNGQHGPHVAPGFLLLPCCGWCWWAPLQVTWRRSATVVSPDQEFRTLEPLKLRNQVFSISNSLSLLPLSWSFWLLLTTFDLAHYCPNNRTFILI